ncbi:hypothetical protein DBR32_09315 [Taibaiella sp. KBW10]|uniref:glycosyltransferase n=1 Tax=Taibaiella sp. KBW10 TaxID=2153357 RepID=UPI000F5AA161|nr:glycosyltransferase [Taibaiella sp. KBW10]RQO30900.1 hypothetical protein DBR32_09315 [Taibaiella sp. KBW10]
MLYTIISFFLCAVYIVLMGLYRYGFTIEKRKPFTNAFSEHKPTFSIIIPARDEAGNIAACLQSILRNTYDADRFEIILIDDFSTDETVSIAQKILSAPHRILQLKDYLSPEETLNAYKKKALEIAIGMANGSYILTTDADCILPPNWLALYAQQLEDPAIHFIAAPVSFTPFDHHRSWLYYFQSLDFMTMQGITIASNRLGLGNMCNGANMLFSKVAFDAVEGYKGIDHKASGDDMMLMQKINMRFPGSIRFLFSQEAIVETPVQPTLKHFINQRIRWASKADSYPQFKMTLILLAVYLFNVNLLFLTIVSLCIPAYCAVLLLCLSIKIVAELYFLYPVSRFFHKANELLFFIFLQPLHILYIIIAGFLGKFGKYSWKGRIVK